MPLYLEELISEEEIHDLDTPTMSQSPANCAACTKCGGGIVRPRADEIFSEVDELIRELEMSSV